MFGHEASYQNSQRLVSEQGGHDKDLKSTCLASVCNVTARLRIGGKMTTRALTRLRRIARILAEPTCHCEECCLCRKTWCVAVADAGQQAPSDMGWDGMRWDGIKRCGTMMPRSPMRCFWDTATMHAGGRRIRCWCTLWALLPVVACAVSNILWAAVSVGAPAEAVARMQRACSAGGGECAQTGQRGDRCIVDGGVLRTMYYVLGSSVVDVESHQRAVGASSSTLVL